MVRVLILKVIGKMMCTVCLISLYAQQRSKVLFAEAGLDYWKKQKWSSLLVFQLPDQGFPTGRI